MRTLRSKRTWMSTRGWIGAVPGLLVLFVLILYPLIALLLQTFLPHLFDVQMSWGPSLKPLEQVFTDKENLLAVGNSLLIGVLAAVISTLFGTMTAFGVSKAPKPYKTLLDVSVWIIFFAPSYVIAQGWMILMQDGGIIAQLFGLHNGWSALFFTKFGLVITMGLRYFPFVHFAMTQSIENIGAEFVQAGRMLGASRRKVFWEITLPLMTPAILAGASIAFAEGFGDFGFAAAITPQTHIPLITYQIYAALSQAPVDYATAAGLSLLLILVTSGALWLQMWWMKRRTYATVTTHSKTAPSVRYKRMPMVTRLSIALSLIALVLPIGATTCASLWRSWSGGMAVSNWTFKYYADALHFGSQDVQSLSSSLLYALTAAVFTMLIGVIVSYQMAFRKSIATRFANMITISTIAIPGLVLAAGFIFAWNALWLVPLNLVLYGTPICLAMAYIAGSVPYAIRLQLGAMSQLSPNLMTAAQSLGANDWTVLRRIVLPLVSATAISTFFMTFTGTMFELPASSLLYPAGQPPFPVTIASKFNAFEWSEGSALTIVGMCIVLGAYGLGRYTISRFRYDQRVKRATSRALPIGHGVEATSVTRSRRTTTATET